MISTIFTWCGVVLGVGATICLLAAFAALMIDMFKGV